MAEYEPDLTKIHPNPFGFKTNQTEARQTLGVYLRAMARFFETESPQPGEVEDVWQRYQDSHGDHGVLRLALSLQHVGGLERDFAAIHACGSNHDLGRLGSLQVLLYLGLIELVEGGGYVSQFRWGLRKLKEKALAPVPCGFPWYAPWRRSVRPKDIRQFLVQLEEAYVADRGTARSLVRSLDESLDHDDKRTLLNGWTFSDEYRLGEKSDPWTRKHLHCRLRSVSTSGACDRHCRPATEEEIRELFPVLVKDHLYLMRNEIVHAASPVLIAGTPSKEFLDGAPVDRIPTTWSVTTVDGYFVGNGILVSYECTVTIHEVVAVFRRCLWKRLRGV